MILGMSFEGHGGIIRRKRTDRALFRRWHARSSALQMWQVCARQRHQGQAGTGVSAKSRN